ncbi:hypothetical protein BBK82_07330 [Lentzea guizhouensis]|uniref:Uncharacterized protein n=1 Tax=Lentzea guizhouensis TaxID=1586287 RepID=A0A1B2HDW6_9PSEU|nr:hypothetical protein [Lentzea guizhouensis]ANZ35920.1 hypothetical protein BBK82_07330 [Lentzea guizhouensis]
MFRQRAFRLSHHVYTGETKGRARSPQVPIRGASIAVGGCITGRWIRYSIGQWDAVAVYTPRTPREASSLGRAALRSIEG